MSDSHELLDSCERQHALDPENINLSDQLWEALQRVGYLSGTRAIQAYRAAAIASSVGTIRLARAFEQLLELSGETPNPHLFDPALRAAIMHNVGQLSREDAAKVLWLCSAIGLAIPNSGL